MCLWRAPEKYIAGAALDRADLHKWLTYDGCQPYAPTALYLQEDSRYLFLLDAEQTTMP
jgi:hypothetical protein